MQEKKQLYEYFKQQTGKIAHKKTWIWIKKGKLLNRNWISVYFRKKAYKKAYKNGKG